MFTFVHEFTTIIMETLQITSKEFADKQELFFDLAAQGAQVFIRRGENHFFVLAPIRAEYVNNDEEYYFSPNEIAHIGLAQQQARKGQVTHCNTVEDTMRFFD
ncbi:hypothetical protein FACS1894195_4840 [Bacteroidia bacterium]|nr:hypothetical protein FACS1894195_4840 [Bacteroidia bacterium]